MKKIKMMITAILVVAVVSSTFAFKTMRNITVFCGDQDATAGTTSCPALSNTDYRTDGTLTTYCTSVNNSSCSVHARTISAN